MTYGEYLVAGVDADEPGADGRSLMDRIAEHYGGYNEERPHASLVQWAQEASPGLRAFIVLSSRHPRVPWTVFVGVPVLEGERAAEPARVVDAVGEARAKLAALGHPCEPRLWLVRADDGMEDVG